MQLLKKNASAVRLLLRSTTGIQLSGYRFQCKGEKKKQLLMCGDEIPRITVYEDKQASL